MSKKEGKQKRAHKNNKKKSDLSPIARVIFFIEGLYKKLKKSAPISRMIYKEKVIIHEKCGTNDGYALHALRVKMCQKVLCVILILTVLFGIFFAAGRMGVDDIYYMAMDIGYMNSYSETSNGILNYTKTQNSSDFALYKNGLAAVSNSEITLFNATGRVTQTYGDVFSNPSVITSNKYVLVYDIGGSKFSVYNSFKKLHTVNVDGNIACASMHKSGSFSVIVKTADYKSVMYMYDEDCNEIGTYSSNKYVISSDISENGKYTALLSTSAENGRMSSEISVIKRNKKNVYARFDIGDFTPYMCRMIDNNRVAVVCSDRVLVYSLKGKLRGEYLYPDHKLSYISFDGKALSLLFEEDLVNGQNRLVVLNRNGKNVYEGEIKGNFTDMQMYDDYVFLLTNNGICKFNYKTKITTFKEGDDTFGQILVCDKNRVLICTDSRGIYFDI